MMDVKEIASRLVHGYWKRDQWNIEYFDSVGFAEAIISAYKTELLKEAGEPVAEYKTYTGNGEFCAPFNQVMLNSWVTPPVGTKLYTSDQLAAAILKATGTLEEELRSRDDFIAMLQETQKDQLAKAEQLWQIAQGRCDGLEEKLAKAEQRVGEWQPIETAPKDGSEILLCSKKGRIANGVWMTATDRVGAWLWPYIKVEPTHWMPLPKPPAIDAAIAKG